MGRIEVLPAEVANQIAAGEVVERPASVVKELVENALDAGASRIEVRTVAGGTDLIEVGDNGSGMGREDALLASERHATSKVRRLVDLTTIRSFGFRGEALPSIASVSRFELVTSEGGPADGVRVRIEGGRALGAEPAAHPRGTTVRVGSLFFNAPGRRKFLRSPATEMTHVVDLLARLAAAHPAIAFRLVAGEREQFHWPAADDVAARVSQILGAPAASSLLSVDHREAGMRVTGLVSMPQHHRASTRDELLFVNGRPVRDRRLLHAVHQAYATLLPRGRFPMVFLFLDVPVDAVDVNVHPAKTEVRFERPGAVHDLVLRGVRRAHEVTRPYQEMAGVTAGQEPFREGPGASGLASGSSSVRTALLAEPAPATYPSPAQLPIGADLGVLQPLAQFRDTYIVASSAEGMVIVDQHAAHERVLYERHLADAAGARVERQRLLFPSVLELTPAQRSALAVAEPSLAELGFLVAPFGPGAMRIEEVPAAVPAGVAVPLVLEILDETSDRERPQGAEALRHRIAASTACHAAVRANQALTLEPMRRIVSDLMQTRSPMTCPHGRPTLLKLPLDRLEREFRRR
jgi:DNA mismatch repair protein MutL